MGMVRAGLGISVVPSLTLFHFRDPQVVTRPLGWRGLTRRLYLVRRRDRSLSLAAETLHALLLRRKPAAEAASAAETQRGAARSRAAPASAARPRPNAAPVLRSKARTGDRP
jgi:hypothetical protein